MIFNRLDYPIAIIDQSGNFIETNKAFLELFSGLSTESVIEVSPRHQNNGKETTVYLKSILDDASTRDKLLVNWTFRKTEHTNFDSELEVMTMMVNHQPAFILSVKQMSSKENISSLTQLPNRFEIRKHVENSKGLRSKRTLLSINVNNFKPYNDKYGFEKGDELIIFLSQLLKDIPSNFELEDFFLGHLGEDKFIAVLDEKYAKDAADLMCGFFDQSVTNFYNGLDKNQGSIQLVTRAGIVKDYPLMTLRIGGLNLTDVPSLKFHQILDICSELVEKSKDKQESNAYFNKRHY